MIIGIDLDNTIISYDDLWQKLATERGLPPVKSAQGKTAIRDDLRNSPGGDLEWQKIQQIAYGPRIGEATLMVGFDHFLKKCRQKGIQVYIVSHKTVGLRDAAMNWMKQRGFFAAEGFGLDPERDVFFGSTREEKIKRVNQLKCSWFIDDLKEIFQENAFPKGVGRILFSPHASDKDSVTGIHVMKTWKEIDHYLLGE